MDALFVENSKNTACPEVFGMSNMRKCAKCRVYQIFRCTRSSSCVRERDDGGNNDNNSNHNIIKNKIITV